MKKSNRLLLFASALAVVLSVYLFRPGVATGQRICVITTANGIDYGFSKLRINVERQGGNLMTINPLYQSTSDAVSNSSGMVLFLHQAEGESITRSAFNEVMERVWNGGRAVIFVTELGANTYADLVLDSLRTATKVSDGLFTENSTPNYIQELGSGRLGAGPVQYQRGQVTRTYNPSMADVFFLPPISSEKEIVLQKKRVENLSSGEKKVVYMKMNHGEGVVILAASPQTKEGFANPFFSDTNIGRYENRALATRLVRWLSSSTS